MSRSDRGASACSDHRRAAPGTRDMGPRHRARVSAGASARPNGAYGNSRRPRLSRKAQRGVRRKDGLARGTIQQLGGEEFNVNSNLQLQRILFEKLALPKTRKI